MTTAPTASRPGGLSLVGVTALAPTAWGTTYLVTTELLPPGRPLLAAALRALPAGLALHVLTRHRPAGAWWAKAMALGTLNIGAFFALLFVAAHRLPGGVAATLGAIQPLVAAVLAAAVLGERVRARTLAAGLLGLVGVTLLVVRADAGLDGVGILAGLAGAASMAAGVTLTKRWGRPVPLLAFTSWQLVAGGIVLVPLTLLVEGMPPAPTASNVAGHLWLATVGTAVAYAVWFRGIEHLPVARASLLGLLSPLVATFAGWAVLDQRLGPAQVGGAALVLCAVVIGQREAPGQTSCARRARKARARWLMACFSSGVISAKVRPSPSVGTTSGSYPKPPVPRGSAATVPSTTPRTTASRPSGQTTAAAQT
jgi:probable blue pigment (indigoidine) exporter